MLNISDLNPMQQKAVNCLEGPLLIMAGAGSGKTKVLTYRIANLLEHNVPPYAILAITFTNKAALDGSVRFTLSVRVFCVLRLRQAESIRKILSSMMLRIQR